MAHAHGETHYKARGKLSDADIELVRQLRERYGLSYNAIALKMESTKATIRDYCKYRRRATITTRCAKRFHGERTIATL